MEKGTDVLKEGFAKMTKGGRTGLSTMLRGLKKYTSHITAIVTVGDDGGGSGHDRSYRKIIQNEMRRQ